MTPESADYHGAMVYGLSVASAAGTRLKEGGVLRREREGRGVDFGDPI